MRFAGSISSTLAVAMLLAIPADAASTDDAIGVVANLHASLVDVANQDPPLSIEQRFEALTPVIRETHDLTRMAKLTVSNRYWREWTDLEKETFNERFARYSVMNYASRFSSVGADTFEILDGSMTGDALAEVNALIRPADGDPVPIRYQLQLDGGVWRIINIFPKGTSEIVLMRTKYLDILDSGEFEDLIEELDEEISEL